MDKLWLSIDECNRRQWKKIRRNPAKKMNGKLVTIYKTGTFDTVLNVNEIKKWNQTGETRSR